MRGKKKGREKVEGKGREKLPEKVKWKSKGRERWTGREEKKREGKGKGETERRRKGERGRRGREKRKARGNGEGKVRGKGRERERKICFQDHKRSFFTKLYRHVTAELAFSHEYTTKNVHAQGRAKAMFDVFARRPPLASKATQIEHN